MLTPNEQGFPGSFESALQRLDEIVRDGLLHGFFTQTIGGEIVRSRKRRLVREAGKSYQYTITEEDVIPKAAF